MSDARRVRRLALALLLLQACPSSEKPAPPPAPKRAERTMPIKDGKLNTGKPDEVRVRTDLTALREALRIQKETGGELPEDVDELGVEITFPDDIVYDAKRGTVRSKSYPAF